MKAYFKDAARAKKNNPKDLVQANLGLVTMFAKDFAYGDYNLLQEYVSAGHLGLIKAAERFDPDRGFKFSTYARGWIRSSMFELNKNLREKGFVKVGGADYTRWDVDSIDRPLFSSSDGTPKTVADVIPNESEDEESIYNSEFLYKLIELLDDEEKEIISRRYGLDEYGAAAAKDIGTLLGYSEQTVTGKIRRAFVKLREAAKTGV